MGRVYVIVNLYCFVEINSICLFASIMYLPGCEWETDWCVVAIKRGSSGGSQLGQNVVEQMAKLTQIQSVLIQW